MSHLCAYVILHTYVHMSSCIPMCICHLAYRCFLSSNQWLSISPDKFMDIQMPQKSRLSMLGMFRGVFWFQTPQNESINFPLLKPNNTSKYSQTKWKSWNLTSQHFLLATSLLSIIHFRLSWGYWNSLVSKINNYVNFFLCIAASYYSV